jgi:hypothetical protein
MSKLGTTTLLLAVAISASDAQACGEVMYRMGGALRYHAFITHHPAQILIYDGDAARQAQGANGQFRANLERAGHKVTVVNSPDALATALAAQPYDVVITYAADLPAISQQIAQVAHEPSLIPVFRSSDEEVVRERYPLALNDDANLNQFLKTIEQTMKGRGT